MIHSTEIEYFNHHKLTFNKTEHLGNIVKTFVRLYNAPVLNMSVYRLSRVAKISWEREAIIIDYHYL